VAAIKDEFDVEPELIQGSGGVFDVTANGKVIYSKHETGRFPEHHEVLTALHKQK
jgi:selT/selW/selH-like putative selenoprotein